MTWRLIRKKLGPDYHRLKTMAKRSIEQEIRKIRILGAEMEILRRNVVVKNQVNKTACDKEFLEIVGNGKPTGSVSKGDNCSFRRDINKRGKTFTIKSVSEFFHAAE